MRKYAMAIIAVIAALFLAGCDDVLDITKSDEDKDKDPKGTVVTYEIEQIGGKDNTANSSAILFTFSSEDVDDLNLTAANITVTGAASKSSAGLSGSGTTRILGITVIHAGPATVSIVKNGIEAGTKHVDVYMKGETAPTLDSIEAEFDDTFAVHPHTELDSLKDHLTVKAVYSNDNKVLLSAGEYELEGDLSQYGDTDITVIYEDVTGTFTVNVVTDTTIVKTDPDVTWPTGLKATVGQTLADVLLDECVNLGGQPGTFSWTTPDTDVGALGNRTHNMTFTPEDLEDFNIVTEDVTIEVISGCVEHTWGEWELSYIAPTVTEDGEDIRTCTVCNAHDTRRLWATGTEGLAYTLINGDTAYRVWRGAKPTTEYPTLHIPAYWRPVDSTDYDGDNGYKPVTEINRSFVSGYNNQPNTTLTTLTFAENREPTIINPEAFRYCPALTGNITIPSNVEIVNDGNNSSSYSNAFRGSGITSVTLKEGVIISGRYAFADCTSLTSVTIEEGVIIRRRTGDSGTYAIDGSYAFYGCTGITEVNIAAGVIIRGDNVFQNCTDLASVTISANTETELTGSSMFSGCTNLTSLTLNEGITSIGTSMFNNCSNLASVTIPASVTTIGNGAFRGSGLISVTIPAGVTSLGDSEFYGCTKLTSVTFAAGIQLQSLGNSMFNGCTSLTNITIPASVTSLGSSEFSGCTSLTSITIPVNVTTIGSSAFSGCASLTNITVDANNPNYASTGGILYNKDKTTIIAYPSASGTVTIPTGVTTIGADAFNGDTSITNITIPEGVTTIEANAFQNCTGLKSITIPASVTTIEAYAFQSCTGLTSITIPAGVTSIRTYAFQGTSITSVTFEGNNTAIDNVNSFPASLKTVYDAMATKSGTYVWNGTTWTKQ
jgi:hypothetical protein